MGRVECGRNRDNGRNRVKRESRDEGRMQRQQKTWRWKHSGVSVKTFSAHVVVVFRLVVSEKRFSAHGRARGKQGNRRENRVNRVNRESRETEDAGKTGKFEKNRGNRVNEGNQKKQNKRGLRANRKKRVNRDNREKGQ